MSAETLMVEHASDWLDAVDVRRSHRRYVAEPTATEILDALDAVCAGFVPWPDARVTLVRDVAQPVFTGIVGSYGKITGARHALLMIADTSTDASQQHTGYTGEAAILHATALGVNTCWIAGAFSPTLAATLVDLSPAEKVVAVSPIGHATAPGFTDRSMRFFAKSSSRKPLEEIAPGIDASWPGWARRAVEAARLAPSAVNRQPWRFRLDDGSLVVARDQPLEVPKVTRSLDCGIAMLHAELAARAAGVTGDWEDISDSGLDVARFRPRS